MTVFTQTCHVFLPHEELPGEMHQKTNMVMNDNDRLVLHETTLAIQKRHRYRLDG